MHASPPRPLNQHYPTSQPHFHQPRQPHPPVSYHTQPHQTLRTTKSAPRLRRRNSRDEMPPPPLSTSTASSTSRYHREGPARQIDRVHQDKVRTQEPSKTATRGRPTQAAAEKAYPGALSSTAAAQRSTSQGNTGWTRTPRSVSPSSAPAATLPPRTKTDSSDSTSASPSLTSTFSSSSILSTSSASTSLSSSSSSSSTASAGERAAAAMGLAGNKVGEGWKAIRGMVGNAVGEEGGAEREGWEREAEGEGQGSQLWTRLTTSLTTSYSYASTALQSSLPANLVGKDPDEVGVDGETQLGRAIKEFHLSKCETVQDVPDWLLSPTERAAHNRHQTPTASLNRAESDPAIYGQQQQHWAPSASRAGGPSQPRSQSHAGGGARRGEQEPVRYGMKEEGREYEVRKTGGSAAERLRRMREERKRGVVG